MRAIKDIVLSALESRANWHSPPLFSREQRERLAELAADDITVIRNVEMGKEQAIWAISDFLTRHEEKRLSRRTMRGQHAHRLKICSAMQAGAHRRFAA